jgi:hypothetical protein
MAGEVTEAQRSEVQTHLDECRMCAERSQALEAGRESFLQTPPPRAMPGERPARARVKTIPILVPSSVVILLALAFLLHSGLGSRKGDPALDLGIRTKGQEHLGFLVKRDRKVTRGSAGEVLYPGDALQFFYTSTESAYLAVISVDGAGRVSVYHPEGNRAQAIEPGNEVALSSSVVLDEVLGPETIYGLFCKEPIAIEPVVTVLRSRPHEPPIPKGCRVRKIRVVKKTR